MPLIVPLADKVFIEVTPEVTFNPRLLVITPATIRLPLIPTSPEKLGVAST